MSENAPSGLSDLYDLDDLKNPSYLSNAISYKTDIAPYRIIEIFAGVGSGKNKFINRFLKGDPQRGIPRMTTLVITSRRSKVNELLSDEEVSFAGYVGDNGNLALLDEDDVENFFDYLRIIPDEWGGFPRFQKSVACTNAFIEKYLRYKYKPNVPSTHLWNLFDMIVVDEFHSLVMDASYQTAPFYVNSLILEFAYRHHLLDQDSTIARPLCKHLILMTGTPEIVRKLPLLYAEPHVLDMMGICRNVVPKNVWFVDHKQARDLVEQKISAGKRCIYFTNHVQLPDEFCEGTTIPPSSVAASFSKKELRNSLLQAASITKEERTEEQEKMAQLYADIIEAEDSVARDGLIPQWCQLWLTTSRNKEGININDTDIDDVFVESHCVSDIKQMAGRVRHGADNLYIIVDSEGYTKTEYRYEDYFSSTECAPDIRALTGEKSPSDWFSNHHLEELCKEKEIRNFYANRNSDFCPYQEGSNDVRDYIQYIEDRFSFVHFDYFCNYFCYYYLRKVACQYNEDQARKFQKASSDYSKYVESFQKIFPTSTVHPYKDRLEQMKDYVERQLDGNPMKEFTTDEIKQHTAELNRLRYDEAANYLCSPNSILKQIGFKVKRICNDQKKPGYNRWRYRQMEPDQMVS